MSYNVETLASFRKSAKKLSKKYPELKAELAGLGEKLALSPTLGTPLGNDCYKIRLAIPSKRKGKSGGARIVTHVYVAATTVYLLSIYDKSDKESISDRDLKDLLKSIHP
jgi:mRNA-degrading endonuclease RelE of RelBE toxin-antitoxin system